jgi:hypothetical protein
MITIATTTARTKIMAKPDRPSSKPWSLTDSFYAGI